MSRRARSICLLDCQGHFTRLAVAKPDLAITVTYDRQCGKAELATTLDHFYNAVDGYQFLDQIVSAVFSCHDEFRIP